MLFTESDRNAIEHECEMMIGKPAFDAIEAAVLEKLCAGVAMPQAFSLVDDELVYTADQLRAYGAAQRLKALEDAADIVDNAVTPDCGGWSANGIADAIRALKGEA